MSVFWTMNTFIPMVQNNAPSCNWPSIWKMVFLLICHNLKVFNWRITHGAMCQAKKLHKWGIGDVPLARTQRLFGTCFAGNAHTYSKSRFIKFSRGKLAGLCYLLVMHIYVGLQRVEYIGYHGKDLSVVLVLYRKT